VLAGPSIRPLEGAEGFVWVKDGRFVDPAGRQLIPHGINIGAKFKETNYVSWHGPAEFARMRAWGFNCVRLLIIWAALEPDCGRYDEEYLRRIDQRIAWAKENGLYVLIDMHQDLWGEKCAGGDGAPAWATLDDGRPDRRLGVVWSDGYLVSPMIQTAFDNFWANKPGPDGVGIQDRFALAWQHVARRYADDPTVIGYDLLNEPFAGSMILLAQAAINRKLVQVFGVEESPTRWLGLTQILADRTRRHEIFEKLNDVEVYRSVVDAAEPMFGRFEQTKLGPMYQRVAKAIRQVDPRHILFLEPSVSANQGVLSHLPPVLGEDGTPDPLQAYCPHAYDIVTDVSGAGPANEARIQLIGRRLRETAHRLKVPMLIGEWGAFPGTPKWLPAARAMVRMIEETLAGDTYWFFEKDIEKHGGFEMLRRPYPSAVAGVLLRYRLDPSTGTFECAWREDAGVKEPTRIYVPSAWYPAGHEVDLTPPGTGCRFEPIGTEAQNGYLSIPPTGQAEERGLVLRPKRPAR